MRFFLSFCGLFFALTPSIGQGQIAYGIKGGGSLCNTYKLLNEDYEYHRLGWYAGAEVQIPISKRFFLQPELLYSSKGFRYISYIPFQDKAAVHLNYLSVPLMVNYKISDKFFGGIGPEVNYLVSAKNRYPSKEVADISDQYPLKFDFGIDVTAAYKILPNLDVELRYNYGFRTFYYTDAVGTRVGESRGANRAIHLGICYFLDFDYR